MERKHLIYLYILIIAIIGGIIVTRERWLNSPEAPSTPSRIPATFEECAQAGHPIMESYPRRCAVPGGPTFTEKIPTPPTSVTPSADTHTDKIKVTAPEAGTAVSNPLTVTGTARGNWYFEASFPVVLKDGNGVILAQVPAQAQGEWMTSDFVPFSATLTFSKPTTPNGTLILQKDNPSGLPEHDDSIEIPVNFE